MKTVAATVYGKEYLLACDAGQEERLGQLVGEVNQRVEQLIGQVGRLQEPTMLLYAALMLADELSDVKQGTTKLTNDLARATQDLTRAKQQAEAVEEARLAALEEGMAESLHALANRIEGIAEKLAS
jgi:cell division protein ZapA